MKQIQKEALFKPFGEMLHCYNLPDGSTWDMDFWWDSGGPGKREIKGASTEMVKDFLKWLADTSNYNH
jgi:hypothetical protein